MSYLVPSEFVTKMVDAGESKIFMSTRDTLIRAYMAKYGVAGWFTIFLRGMLCNWMVCMGVVGAMVSTSVSGKVIAMWMPILVFFCMTFEHSVVNMFLFPATMIMGGSFSIADHAGQPRPGPQSAQVQCAIPQGIRAQLASLPLNLALSPAIP
jgi:formate/nitrite transporter FocA (FNT family)